MDFRYLYNNNSSKMYDILKFITKSILIILVISMSTFAIVLFLSLSIDNINETNNCISLNFDKCIKEGFFALSYFVICLVSLSLPLILLMGLLRYKNIVSKDTIYSYMHCFNIMVGIMISISWMFIAPLLGILWRYTDVNMYCINYIESFILCGIYGNIVIIIVTFIFFVFIVIHYTYLLCKNVNNEKTIPNNDDMI